MLKMITINTVMYWLVVQITLKLYTALQDKSSRTNAYGKLYFYAVHLKFIEADKKSL